MHINPVEPFVITVKNFPIKLAISDELKTYPFKELQQGAQVIAHNMSKTNESINIPITVLLPKINHPVASLLGIFYTGNYFAPLNINNPVDKLKSILASLNQSYMMTNNKI